MFSFDMTKFQRVATAAVAALVLTSISVSAAVGPARAVETGPVYAAATQASDQAHV